MSFIHTMLQSIILILDLTINFYIMIIICRSVISFFDIDPYHYIIKFLAALTEPVLKPIRRTIPSFYAGYDLSPVILIFALVLFKFLILVKLLKGFLLGIIG